MFNGAGGEKNVGTNAMTNVTVTLPDNVRNADTPDAMIDRIPPRVATPLKVKVSPDLGNSGQVVTLFIPKANSTNGTVDFQQPQGGTAISLDITSSDTIKVQGGAQTTAGKNGGEFAGRLKLTVKVHGQETTAATPGFSVAAIPVNWSESLNQLFTTGAFRGLSTICRWESDSGVVADLSEVRIRESLNTTEATGNFKGETFKQSGYKSATSGRDVDRHFQSVNLIQGQESEIDYFQVNFFLDKRTGSREILIPDAGYQVVQKTKNDNGIWSMRTTKKGAAATVVGLDGNTYTSQAGSVVGKAIDSGDQRR